MVSARAYPTAFLPKLNTDSLLRARTAASSALVDRTPRPVADAFVGRAANDAHFAPTSALPRRSEVATEPVASTAWGRALQMVRSWFQPAATAALLGAGLVPSLFGTVTGAGAAHTPVPPPAPDPQAPTAAFTPAPAWQHTPDPLTASLFGDRDAAVSTASDVLFGPVATAPAANDERYELRPSSPTTPLGSISTTPRLGPQTPRPWLVAEATIPGLTGTTRTSSPVTPSLADLMFRPATPWSAALQPRLERGMTGEAVVRLQERLNELGYDVGSADGSFGRQTRTGVLEYQFDNRDTLRVDGRVGQATWRALALGQNVRAAEPTHTPGGLRIQPQYRPFARDTIRLFEEAADRADLPRSWASSPGLHNLLRRESHGEVGRLNYTYGNRSERDVHAELRAGIISARSSATGIGQLLLSNVDNYYPSGRAGIGDPVEEATGMLRYIDARYGSPAAAWAAYGRHHEGY